MNTMASIVASETGCPPEDALVEAVCVASTDGLFGYDLFRWDQETGAVYADVIPAYPKESQARGEFTSGLLDMDTHPVHTAPNQGIFHVLDITVDKEGKQFLTSHDQS